MPEREGERDNVYSWANEQVRECYQIEAFFFFLNKYLWKWWASLVAQTGNNPPAMQETWVRSMGHENPLEEEMSTHYSKFQGQRNLTGYSPWGRKELDMTEWLTLSFFQFKKILKNNNSEYTTPNFFSLLYLTQYCKVKRARGQQIWAESAITFIMESNHDGI